MEYNELDLVNICACILASFFYFNEHILSHINALPVQDLNTIMHIEHIESTFTLNQRISLGKNQKIILVVRFSS